MDSNEYALYVEKLTVSFDGFKAVDDVSLYVENETVHVVIGPNGAGKTTLAGPDLRQDQAHGRFHQV